MRFQNNISSNSNNKRMLSKNLGKFSTVWTSVNDNVSLYQSAVTALRFLSSLFSLPPLYGSSTLVKSVYLSPSTQSLVSRVHILVHVSFLPIIQSTETSSLHYSHLPIKTVPNINFQFKIIFMFVLILPQPKETFLSSTPVRIICVVYFTSCASLHIYLFHLYFGRPCFIVLTSEIPVQKLHYPELLFFIVPLQN